MTRGRYGWRVFLEPLAGDHPQAIRGRIARNELFLFSPGARIDAFLSMDQLAKAIPVSYDEIIAGSGQSIHCKSGVINKNTTKFLAAPLPVATGH
jgi:hypothetical protein